MHLTIWSIKLLSIMPTFAPSGVSGPTTNLNIGMDYWGAPTSSTLPALHGKVPSTAVAGGMVTSESRDSVILWMMSKLDLYYLFYNSKLAYVLWCKLLVRLYCLLRRNVFIG